jgi:hypothetical protein
MIFLTLIVYQMCIFMFAVVQVTVNDTSRLLGFFNLNYYPVCSDNWSGVWSYGVCKSLGGGAPISTTSVSYLSDYYVRVTNNSSYNVSAMQLTSTCDGSNVIRLVCMDAVCGSSSVTSAYIVGGDVAASNAWPWAAVLQYNGGYRCNAVLIGSGWLLTAGHCFFSETNGYAMSNLTYRFSVRLQTTRSSGFDPQLKVFGVRRVVVHPNYTGNNGVMYFDVALVQLGDILFAPVVSTSPTPIPVCLPNTALNTALLRTLQCYVAGWGLTDPYQSGML